MEPLEVITKSPRILVGSRAGDGGLAVWGEEKRAQDSSAQDASQQQTKETRERKKERESAFQSQL